MQDVPTLEQVLNIAKETLSKDSDAKINLTLLRRIRYLFERDYQTVLIRNLHGAICSTYPSLIIAPVSNKVIIIYSHLIFIFIL